MRKIAIMTLFAFVLGGCSVVQSKKIDYKSATTMKPLEAPPDLVMPSPDSHYMMPAGQSEGSASYSAYRHEHANQPVATGSEVLPKVPGAKIERDGSERWLVVDVPPQKVWPIVKNFWQSLGFVINVNLPQAGIMETDWAENRAKIPQDVIRKYLGKVFDDIYSTDERDKFRTRLEPTPDGKGTEIYISHRGMYQVYEGTLTGGNQIEGGDQGNGQTIWEPRAPDPGLEAEMLRRLMLRFGVSNSEAKTMLAKPEVPRADLVKTADGAPGVAVPESFEHTWRRVGLALDRVGFLVVDRDHDHGVYYVRYADPEAELKAKEDKGFLSKLAFWRSDKKPTKALKYRVTVTAKNGKSEVGVYMDDGKPATNDTGKRIAKLLYDQLK